LFCPFCKHTMIVVEHNRIELDYCPHCHGVWFDNGEIELWLKSIGSHDGSHFLGDILKAPMAETDEKERKCPVCRQGMKKVHIGKELPVLVDACPRGNGIWFDGGELGHIVKQITGKPAGEADSQTPVAAFLAEVFKARD